MRSTGGEEYETHGTEGAEDGGRTTRLTDRVRSCGTQRGGPQLVIFVPLPPPSEARHGRVL